jgi:hypothetical protein
MLNETVRPQTLPNELALQLLLGNALEIVHLLDAGCEVEAADRDVLKRTADSLTLQVDSQGSVRLAATTPESLDLLVAASRSSLGATDLTALRTELDRLANGLRELAEDLPPEIDMPSMIDALSSLRDALVAQTALQPDEVRGSFQS